MPKDSASLILCHVLFLTTVNCNVKNLMKILQTSTAPTTAAPNETTVYPFAGRNNNSDFSWMDDALKDIAYFLRAHKFNEYDRRYEKDPNTAPKNYFSTFPRPPLRSLHWEVHKFCEPSFLTCVEYLRKQIRGTDLKRVDDTAVVIQENRWNTTNHTQQINGTEIECRRMLKVSDALANPFQGPLERFQWRTTASYYMCWYTVNQVPDLQHLKEPCDNFANCLDPIYGTNNKDVRANDAVPFTCAFYSFCPDHCCPLKHLRNKDDCWNNILNPCYRNNPNGERVCGFKLAENTDFKEIVLNHFNVTCKCQQKGFEWSSQYGICVDVDECTQKTHTCNGQDQSCVNLKGSYRCACNWGHIWDDQGKKCMESVALSVIKLQKAEKQKVVEETQRKASSIVLRLYNSLFRSWTSSGEKLRSLGFVGLFLVVTVIKFFR